MNAGRYTDQELVARILSGHPDLFGPLVERHIRAAHAIAYARLGNTADAEDAVQEAFLRAYERLATLRDPAKFGAWLLTIARHEAARVAAKQNRTVTMPDASDVSDAATVQPDPERREINQLLRDHVMRLPESAREVLLLHYFAGHSAREIAALLDLRRAAVLKRLQRGREALAETLLRDLETARPSSESFTKQAARIAALAGAIRLAGVAAPGAAAAASIGFGVSMKVVAASLALIAAGGAIGISVWRSTDSGSVEPAMINAPLLAMATPPETEPETTVDASDDAGLQVNATQNPDEIVTAAARKDDSKAPLPESLSGTWAVEVVGPEGNIDPVTSEAIKRVTLDDRVDEIDVFSTSRRDEIEGIGVVKGDSVAFELLYENNDPDRPQPKLKITLQGPYDPAASELHLSGTSEQSGISVSNGQSAPRIRATFQVPVEMRWRRINAKALTKEQFAKARSNELRELARAIFNHAHKNQGLPPSSLEQLVPLHLPSLRPYSPEAGVQLTYTPPIRFPRLTEVDQNYYVDKSNMEINDGRALQERLMEVERELAREWGDQFISTEPIVEAVYDRFDLILVITQNGEVGVPGEVGCLPPAHAEPLTDPQRAEMVAQCQNHMKQLGLSIKMFGNEQRDERYPAGWFMIYPEYMPDRCILICPGAEHVEVAYEILFPAVTAEELEATYDSLFGMDPQAEDEPGSRARKQSRIPLVIELNECSHSGGRNVLFMDGHTEHIKGPLENDRKLAPFLNLK